MTANAQPQQDNKVARPNYEKEGKAKAQSKKAFVRIHPSFDQRADLHKLSLCDYRIYMAMCSKLRNPKDRKITIDDWWTIPISRHDISEMTGYHITNISRSTKKLINLGFLEYRNHEIRGKKIYHLIPWINKSVKSDTKTKVLNPTFQKCRIQHSESVESNTSKVLNPTLNKSCGNPVSPPPTRDNEGWHGDCDSEYILEDNYKDTIPPTPLSEYVKIWVDAHGWVAEEEKRVGGDTRFKSQYEETVNTISQKFSLSTKDAHRVLCRATIKTPEKYMKAPPGKEIRSVTFYINAEGGRKLVNSAAHYVRNNPIPDGQTPYSTSSSSIRDEANNSPPNFETQANTLGTNQPNMESESQQADNLPNNVPPRRADEKHCDNNIKDRLATEISKAITYSGCQPTLDAVIYRFRRVIPKYGEQAFRDVWAERFEGKFSGTAEEQGIVVSPVLDKSEIEHSVSLPTSAREQIKMNLAQAIERQKYSGIRIPHDEEVIYLARRFPGKFEAEMTDELIIEVWSELVSSVQADENPAQPARDAVRIGNGHMINLVKRLKQKMA